MTRAMVPKVSGTHSGRIWIQFSVELRVGGIIERSVGFMGAGVARPTGNAQRNLPDSAQRSIYRLISDDVPCSGFRGLDPTYR